MELAADVFEQIVASLGPAREEPVPPGAAERRRDKRVAVDAEVFVAPFGVASARPRKVKLRSISRGGATSSPARRASRSCCTCPARTAACFPSSARS